jgi:hypothetical protein
VRFAAMGLLDMGKPVSLVTDAIQYLDPASGGMTLMEFVSRGGRLVKAQEV